MTTAIFFLVILDFFKKNLYLLSEPLVLECFDRLMVRMRANFPLGSGMDDNLANMRSLIQVY